MLTPSNVVSVCSGEQLSLTCSINQSNYLRWTIQIPHSINAIVHVRTVAVDFRVGQAELLAIEINSTSIRFFKNSAINALPLESTLLINSVPLAFNRTIISCTEYGTTGITSDVAISVVEINQLQGTFD